MPKRTFEDRPLASLVGQRGIKNTSDFNEFFTAVMTDVVDGNVDYHDATAICKLGHIALQTVEIEHRVGGGQPVLMGRRGVQVVKPALATPSADAVEVIPNHLQIVR